MDDVNERLLSFNAYLDSPDEYSMHPSDIAYLLKELHHTNTERFYDALRELPTDILGDVLLELPEKVKDQAIDFLTPKELTEAIEELESDDATDLVQDIIDADLEKSHAIMDTLHHTDKEEITKLSSYEENQAGAWMQVELFDANLHESIQDAIHRLREQKQNGNLENIYQVFVTDDTQRLIGAMGLEDLIIQDFEMTFDTIIGSGDYETHYANSSDDIEDVAKRFEKYDLSVLPVVDWQGTLVGRITSDDIYDVIEELATKQVYNLAGVHEDTESEDILSSTVKKRASWLGVNLITAILASLVIALFDSTLQAFIPLAILMPIVASMGGNAGTQTLTVMVRQLALGEIDSLNAKRALKKEIIISVLNGLIFALLIGVIAYLWFSMPLLGVVISLSMFLNMLTAGFFGATIPLLLNRLDVDPAVGSTVILTTMTDVIGFFTFLGLASLILL